MSKRVTIPTCMDPFIVMMNGVRYSYPAGETLEVPDDVAVVIERHNANHKKEPQGTVPPIGGSGISVTAQVGQTIIVKAVDEKGIPTKWEAADYQEKICGVGIGEILPECQPTPIDGDGNGIPNTFVLTESIGLVEGKTYTVNWNGTEYTCVAQDGAAFGEAGMVFLGNVGAMMGGEDTGEPFIGVEYPADVASEVGYAVGFAPIDGTIELTISIKGETIQTIPPKYLPEAQGYDLVLEIPTVGGSFSKSDIIVTGDPSTFYDTYTATGRLPKVLMKYTNTYGGVLYAVSEVVGTVTTLNANSVSCWGRFTTSSYEITISSTGEVTKCLRFSEASTSSSIT